MTDVFVRIRLVPQKVWNLFFSREFFLYFCVGGLATLVDWFFVYFVTDILHVWYVFSVMTGYVGGSFTNYLLNRKYTFKNTSSKIGRQFFTFHIVTSVGFFLNLGIVVFFVEYIGLWYMFAKMFATAVVLVWNFIGHKYITFKK